MKLSQIIAAVQPRKVWGDLDGEISGIAYDSRRVKPGYLFVCVPGLVTDGHKFLPQAIQQGAKAVIISEAEYKPVDFSGTVVLVEDSRRVLSQVACEYYGNPSNKLKVIGVTGTNGKTSTAFLTASILRAAGKKVGLLTTIEYQVGKKVLSPSHTTPESLDLHELLSQMAAEGCDYAVMEVSSHSLSLGRVEDCHFAVAVFTNLTPEHLDFHHDMEAYFKAKQKLFLRLGARGMAITNYDSLWGKRIVSVCKAQIWGYSRSQEADVRLRDYEATSSGLHAEIKVGGEVKEMRSPLLGEYNLENLMAACAVALSQGIEWPVIAQGIGSLAGVPGRFEPINCGQDFTVVVDYAHTEDALLNLLKGARPLVEGRLITVFGCGGQRDRRKRPRMGAVAHELSDYVIITSDNPRGEDPDQIIKEVEAGLLTAGATKDSYEVHPERRQAIEEAIKLAGPRDMVVIAGKGHEDYQVIGNQRLHFDDREVAREAILRINNKER